jgi:hypothetical protein
MVLVGKPAGQRPPGIPRRRLENNIKTDLKEIELGVVDCIYSDLGQGPAVGAFEYENEPSDSARLEIHE